MNRPELSRKYTGQRDALLFKQLGKLPVSSMNRHKTKKLTLPPHPVTMAHLEDLARRGYLKISLPLIGPQNFVTVEKTGLTYKERHTWKKITEWLKADGFKYTGSGGGWFKIMPDASPEIKTDKHYYQCPKCGHKISKFKILQDGVFYVS